jgi:hypothetical protein
MWTLRLRSGYVEMNGDVEMNEDVLLRFACLPDRQARNDKMCCFSAAARLLVAALKYCARSIPNGTHPWPRWIRCLGTGVHPWQMVRFPRP